MQPTKTLTLSDIPVKIKIYFRIYVLISILSLYFIDSSICQNNVFSGQIIIETNFSQIKGDQLAGYHKVGLGGGLGVSYRIHRRWDLNINLLYRNIGSRNSIFFKKQVSISHNIAQIPISISYLTWWDNGLAKFQFDFGIVPGRILESKIKYNNFLPYVEKVKKNDLSLFTGFGLWMNRNHGIFATYTRSMTNFLEVPDESIALKTYFLSLQYHYRF
ncbi:hypothetical protein [Membranihabitans marinus]|uniref:hypothetical protein n=1 Tax=Membranihabitans marinus TaxID=1227546 RepID=UPI001F452608|nr:hypothetical protein [Membranihabitans marinus]